MDERPWDLLLEVEMGAAEPPHLTLTPGRELSPMSVGRQGTWRVEGDGVLDVHGYIYFDGERLFVQSADEDHAILTDGEPVGVEWTAANHPCAIALGNVRLRLHKVFVDDATQVYSEPPETRRVPTGGLPVARDSESTRVHPVAELVRMLPPARVQASSPPAAAGPSDGPSAPPPSAATARTAPGLPSPPSAPAQVARAHSSPASSLAPPVTRGFRALSVPKKILILLLPAILVSQYYVFFVDTRPHARPPAVVASTGPAAPAASAPRTEPQTPAASAAPPPASAVASAGARTLERQAVDLVASGQAARAASVYDQLAQASPQRAATYREAARILRARLDAGAP